LSTIDVIRPQKVSSVPKAYTEQKKYSPLQNISKIKKQNHENNFNPIRKKQLPAK
jgi:hypothetical protein